MLFPMLSVMYFSTKNHTVYSRQNITIQFWKYLVDSRSEAWLNIFWEHINGKVFAVYIDFFPLSFLSGKRYQKNVQHKKLTIKVCKHQDPPPKRSTQRETLPMMLRARSVNSPNLLKGLSKRLEKTEKGVRLASSVREFERDWAQDLL
jgi:hypothetical protein